MERTMGFDWIHESAPRWDDGKAAIVGGAADGIFELANYRRGEMIPGEWWRVEEGGAVLGYGWMDATWGDAEVLLAVEPRARKRGVGHFILEHLEREAAQRGLNYLYNVVSPRHPDRAGVTRWLVAHGFEPGHDDESLRRRVHAVSAPN
jgi:GNAT superfamily N-acetyltransferase